MNILDFACLGELPQVWYSDFWIGFVSALTQEKLSRSRNQFLKLSLKEDWSKEKWQAIAELISRP
jgi:hypothetical protein